MRDWEEQDRRILEVKGMKKGKAMESKKGNIGKKRHRVIDIQVDSDQ